ncbi:MAG: hypothetical protein K9M99_06965 [Candidatus Cloacimonetes bacterium]|nr:hypothetical protein [Candidatus Cloacimonadota bacterium]
MEDHENSGLLTNLWERYNKIEKNLPTPIIEIYNKLRNISSFSDRGLEKKLLDVFEVILKLDTSIMIAKYVEDKGSVPKIDNQISQLIHPSTGIYKASLRVLVNFYKKKASSENENPPFVVDIINFLFDKISSDCFQCLRFITNKLNLPRLKDNENTIDLLIDKLITYRNNFAHGADKKDDSYAELMASLYIVVIELTEKFSQRLSYELVYIENDYPYSSA